MIRFAFASLCVALVSSTVTAQQRRPTCDADNGGLTLPQGFCALVVADSLGPARHIAIAPNGDLFVAIRNTRDAKGGLVALRDTTGDGRADVREWFGDNGGSGIALRGNDLFFGTDDAVLRYRIPRSALRPSGIPDTVVSQLATGRSHASKTIALRGNDLFVNIGSPSNACQVQDRQPQSPGQDPCPELETRAGIWRFDASRTGQTQRDGERWATGIRNAVALTVDPSGALWVAQHGRDNLVQNWPAHFDTTESAELPAEELFRVTRGDNFGWPYCFYDGMAKRKVLAPEYGGDGQQLGRCATVKGPVAAMPAHWAPNGLLFYDGPQFPMRFHGGAFVAFHGSWNRAPRPQGGYNVTFVPFAKGAPAGEHELFATGFAGDSVQPAGARHRPVGLAVGPDGSLYISDDRGGRVWRVVWRGR